MLIYPSRPRLGRPYRRSSRNWARLASFDEKSYVFAAPHFNIPPQEPLSAAAGMQAINVKYTCGGYKFKHVRPP